MEIAEKKQDKLIGSVDKILFKNQDNGYHVLKIESESHGTDGVIATIMHPNIFEGFSYEFQGEWEIHQKFGRQFKATMASEVLPSTREGLKAYLSSSFFPGIGPAISEKIINHFGDDVINVFNTNIDRLLRIPGISKKKLQAIKDSWEKNKEINDIMMFLRQYNISTLYAKKILNFYGRNCVSQILTNPYRLAKDIDGIGFAYADKIALQIGIPENSADRIMACVEYILNYDSQGDGHCFLYSHQIESRSVELLRTDVRSLVREAINSMTKSGNLIVIRVDSDSENRYYSKRVYYNEKYCAEKILLLLDNSNKSELSESLLQPNVGEKELSTEQRQAIRGIISSGVSVLTGGPGRGKSFSLKKLVDALTTIGKDVTLCAPTGRAALRMTQLIGRQSTTIHKLLVWDHENKSFLKNEHNTIETDFVVVDETSMIDINLAASLLKAIPASAQIVFVGDADQLFPVGVGSFFIDLINSGSVPIFKLTKIFRQDKESLIIKNATEINEQRMPVIDTPLLDPVLWKNGTDCLFIDSGAIDHAAPREDYPKWTTQRYGLDFFDIICKLYTETISKYHGSDKEIQILCPQNIGDYGSVEINKRIQRVANPPSPSKREIKIGDKVLREQDRVIQTKNNYDLNVEVFNGDIGTITSINSEKIEVVVKFSEDREAIYSKGDLIDLDLGYSVSIHKSQGSEFDCVIVPLVRQHHRMLCKQLVYVGVTRGKKLVVFVGQRKALEIAVANANVKPRQTSLREMIESERTASPI